MRIEVLKTFQIENKNGDRTMLQMVREMIPLNELTPEPGLPSHQEQDRYFRTEEDHDRVIEIEPGQYLVKGLIYRPIN